MESGIILNGFETDLWERLRTCGKTVVLYGMGNGADKILRVCDEKKIPVREVFASDGFVRGQTFHGMTVRTWSDVKNRYGAENTIVLLAFATSLPDVLANIRSIASEAELYVPDVPVFGEGLFDAAFFHAHRNELEKVRELLSDAESRRIFDLVLRYKLSGDLNLLLEARSAPEEVFTRLLPSGTLRTVADLGAYTGDTARELPDHGILPEKIVCMEPDARNFRKLQAYAESETRTHIVPVRAAAWNRTELLAFDGSGNRNASAANNRSRILNDRPVKIVEIPAQTPDSVLNGAPTDYIKYDVEGSEKEALEGSVNTIRSYFPTLMVSLYHRNEDLFALPLMIHRMFPEYRGFYLRRFGGVPAWDLNLYVRKERL